METRRIFHVAMPLVLALVVWAGMAAAVGAADPWPWGSGIPWLTMTPWPTPHVLRVGERFSFGVSIVPATPTPIVVPLRLAAPTRISVPANLVAPTPISVPANLVAPTPISMYPQPGVVPPAVPTPVAPMAPAVITRDGASPMNALLPDGAPRTLAAGASVWYKIGNGGEHMDVFLDATPLSGVSLAVFAPGNLSDPIGQGTLQKSSGRLVWAGGHWQSEGDWLARVTNSNPMAVQYTLTSSTYSIGKKTCVGYWEYLPTGQYIYWNECR